ncbi:PEP-CTERM sorting domain-containing protein [Verrucomicrobiaceae bacterium N1E253]|uniref:PEP-CTERM sorting domain-containing protein n=1 Tax=Oceaniferula marina TaxID=2748318 RepID=A0A851GLG3_9BACT|nr:PEP-CTERM sorting domain-containing protein [Oceaniferula marina]NWK55917.1 PEP-CTERM sorting domain-containing protein [Oceaniferula marina]
MSGDFSSVANSFFTNPADPTVTAINLTVTSPGGNELAFIDDIDSEAEPQQRLWTNVTWGSNVGRIGTTLFDLLNGPNKLTLSTLTIEDMDLDPQTTQFDFHGTNTELVLNNASVKLSNQPVFRVTSQLSLRSEGTGTSSIIKLTGDQNSPTTIDVASGTTLRFFESGSLVDGLADSARANFNQSNSAVVNGTLNIDQSYVIFNTGPSQEMRVNSGGELSLIGSQSVLETGDLRVVGGTVNLGVGGARLATNDFTLTGATVNIGASSTVESSGASVATGTNTITLGDNARYSTDLLGTAGGNITISGTGTVSTQRLAFIQAGDQINVTESAKLEVTSGAGTPQLLERGSIDIGVNALVDIQAGAAVVAASSTIRNDGGLLVSGRLEPTGTITGDGYIRVQPFGQLGVFGGNGTETFTTSNDVFMEGLSTFQTLLRPDLQESQLMITTGNFEISPIGAYLDPVITSSVDTPLADGTKFALIDYMDGDSWGGFFLRDDNSSILEGDLITEGINTFRLSYQDADYSPGTSSIITLTVIPEPSTGILASLGLLGGTLLRRRKSN